MAQKDTVSPQRSRYMKLGDVPPLSRFETEKSPLRVLLLADDRHIANVVQDHIQAFTKYSRHEVTVVNPIHARAGLFSKNRLSRLHSDHDLILIHYSIFILGRYFLPNPWRKIVENFNGPKAQIIQDEHRHIRKMHTQMKEFGIGAVFSSLEPENLAKVYETSELPDTYFYGSLPGFIDEHFKQFDPPPISERPLDVVYRGRDLIYKLGRMSQEKRQIGERMQAISDTHGLKVDIASTEGSRIYGASWNNFLMSGRTTLGVEGGATIFDFNDDIDPAVEAYLKGNPNAGFEQVWQAVLKPYEGNVEHRTLTPKLLESVAAKTALILYPGRYSGVLQPDRHYIPLERDGSNEKEVVERIRDTAFLQDMVERTYGDLVDKYELSMHHYVTQIDAVLTRLPTHQKNKSY